MNNGQPFDVCGKCGEQGPDWKGHPGACPNQTSEHLGCDYNMFTTTYPYDPRARGVVHFYEPSAKTARAHPIAVIMDASRIAPPHRETYKAKVLDVIDDAAKGLFVKGFRPFEKQNGSPATPPGNRPPYRRGARGQGAGQ